MSTFTILRRSTVSLAAAAALGLAVLPSAPAQASAAWSGLQAGLPYTVYEAYNTAGLPRKSLGTSNVCNYPGTPQTVVKAIFSRGGKKVKLYESTYGCLGQGSSYAPIVYTTFPVQGGSATAEVYPACFTQLQCEFPTNATIRDRGARVRVTLQSDGTHTATVVDVYTKGVPLKKIKTFVWSLGLP